MSRPLATQENKLGWVDLGFESHSGKMKYLTFSFPRSGKEAKCGIEFRHSTCNASRVWRRLENESVLMGAEYLNTRFPGAPYRPYHVRDTACS